MKTKIKSRLRKDNKLIGKKVNYSKKLVEEVKEACSDYKNGNYFKGTVEEVIRSLRDEADKIKKV
ncbi:MAG: hypothetical protein M3R36_17195 [Bacteroidota bacterium]|nr:hypothetical protein [Bacteroidota bacterium]